jgi:hypothetical protein
LIGAPDAAVKDRPGGDAEGRDDHELLRQEHLDVVGDVTGEIPVLVQEQGLEIEGGVQVRSS